MFFIHTLLIFDNIFVFFFVVKRIQTKTENNLVSRTYNDLKAFLQISIISATDSNIQLQISRWLRKIQVPEIISFLSRLFSK